MIKNIFFDFDGVILDSVPCKTEAYRELYVKYGAEIQQKVVDHHLAHSGISRFEKVKHYHKTLLGIDLTEQEVQTWAEKYSRLVLSSVLASPFIKGVESFLESHYLKMDFWVISGTPTVELVDIVNKRSLAKFFKGVCGSPEKKVFWVESIIKEYGLLREETLFIGDGVADYDAAKACGLHFCLRETSSNLDLFKTYSGHRAKDFIEFEQTLANITFDT